jgi:hypothetical protein
MKIRPRAALHDPRPLFLVAFPIIEIAASDMNQFVQRVANYVANEIIIKGLAHSRTFQKFAVRTDAGLREAHRTGTEALNKTLEEVISQAGNAASTATAGSARSARGPPVRPKTGFPGFVSAFFKEIKRDIGIGK